MLTVLWNVNEGYLIRVAESAEYFILNGRLVHGENKSMQIIFSATV